MLAWPHYNVCSCTTYKMFRATASAKEQTQIVSNCSPSSAWWWLGPWYSLVAIQSMPLSEHCLSVCSPNKLIWRHQTSCLLFARLVPCWRSILFRFLYDDIHVLDSIMYTFVNACLILFSHDRYRYTKTFSVKCRTYNLWLNGDGEFG